MAPVKQGTGIRRDLTIAEPTKADGPGFRLLTALRASARIYGGLLPAEPSSMFYHIRMFQSCCLHVGNKYLV
ncbi:hypothetical protein E2562_002605 [Oryza meyeriana var. granulata]|uniref:Uncharacterized protein n=1 Tax=Oryza meyeriana var. granulata TaxID=110450 RepID=A0A6G1F2X6_9ORYZ|nr:hypothetical protein E2562_002605 [Oryza meyeriana var. granulata]